MSKAAVLIRLSCSSTPAYLTMTPERAARLMPPRNATGAAISRGHGVATTRTSAKRSGLPLMIQPTAPSTYARAVNGTA